MSAEFLLYYRPQLVGLELVMGEFADCDGDLDYVRGDAIPAGQAG